jgi:hypothetical protein
MSSLARKRLDFDADFSQVAQPTLSPARPQAKPISAPQDPSAAKPAGTVYVPAKNNLTGYLWTALITGLLMFGYMNRNTDRIVPFEGAGYWIGILGGTLILLQLVYSVVKRMRAFRRLAGNKIWFNLHVILGVAAPVAILYHANFSLGATNSNVALFTMLAVAISGFMGRIVYRNVHVGLHGAKADATSLLEHATGLLRTVEGDVGGSGGQIANALLDFAEHRLHPTGPATNWMVAALAAPFQVGWARIRMNKLIRAAVSENAQRQNWSRSDRRQKSKIASSHVRDFLGAVIKASQLTFWERVFSLWHVVHIPLFYLLLASGITHVIAVHWY